MPSSKNDLVEETALAAEVSAAHAEKAVEQAAKDETAAARAASDTPVCPNDNMPLVKHDGANPYKQGAWHCNSCGTCWAPGIKHPR